MNNSGIRPIEERILVRVKSAGRKVDGDTRTKGGIIIPGQAADRQEKAEMIATVIEVGRDVWADSKILGRDAEFVPEFVAGDTVVMTKYAGLLYTGEDEKEYRIVGLKDIVGVKT